MNENARDALEIGDAAQADSQPHTGLWKAERDGGGALVTELSQGCTSLLGAKPVLG